MKRRTFLAGSIGAACAAGATTWPLSAATGDATDDAAGSAGAQITPTSAPAETAPTDPHANHSGN